MEQYTASNGITVFVRDGGTVQFQHGTRQESCGILQVMPHSEWWQALREFFRAEEDERLGRWRWPENPDYVVYPTENDRDLITVLRESSSRIRKVRRYSLELINDHVEQFAACAEAYFDAHPEPKPWHGAKVGDVWVIRLRGDDYETACLVESFEDTRVFQMPDAESITTTRDIVETARRIWPEDAS